MGLFNALRTSVSGMNAQSSYLSAIGDNIANSNTVGYKEASTQFETVLGQQTPGSYESGGVLAQTRYGITDQGTLTGTSSSTDLAINGNGFFLVSQGSSAGGGTYLTRAGSFVTDTTGNLVNTAGYTLMGYKLGANGAPSTILSQVNVSDTKLQAVATSSGTVTGNLPSTDATTSPVPTRTTPVTLYDTAGNAIAATVSYSYASSDTAANTTTWNVTATDASGNSLLTTSPSTLTFNASGQITAGSPISLSVPILPSSTSTAKNTVSLDFSNMTSLATTFKAAADTDGSPPSTLASVTVGTDGTLTGVFGNGAKQVLYDIPIATVTSPDNLTAITGNIYQQNSTSGLMVVGTAGTGGAGKIESDNLESSTVDLATELTNMITAQRSYEANSKVLQAASDLLSKLNQIQTN